MMIQQSISEDTSYSYNSNDRVPKDALHVIVDDGVTIIENRAFFDCSSLTSISIPSTVTHIGEYAFFGCSSLKHVDIPPSVTSIHLSAFYDCSSLESISIPPSTTSIGAHCFSGCSSLRTFTFPHGTEKVAAYTFHGCKSLISVYVPPSVNLIGNGAFQDCRELVSITLNPDMQYIGARAFHGCDSLIYLRTGFTLTNRPTTSWLEQRFRDLPLHRACYSTNVTCKDLEKIFLRYSKSLESVDAAGFTALHFLACNPNAGLDVMKLLVGKCPKLLNKRTSRGISPMEMILKTRGFKYEKDNPTISLNEALEQGMGLHDIQILFTLNKSMYKEQFKKNKENNLYPFLIAAGVSSCDLDVVYTLTRESVEYIRPYIPENQRPDEK